MHNLQLGYLGFGSQVPDLTASFFENVLGVEIAGTDVDGSLFRIDERSWRFGVKESPVNDIEYLGLDVPDLGVLEWCVERLHAAGFETQEEATGRVGERGATRLVRVTDPDGLRVELAYGARAEVARPYLSPYGHEFVTTPLGLGHVVLATRDMPEALRFYQTLGFRITDVADIPADTGEVRSVTFLRCNPRHHSLALVPADLPRRLRHIMVEMATVDDVGRTFDRALAGGFVSRTLGRHINDGMLSFYVNAPGEIEIEIGCQGRLIDDASWAVSRYAGRPSSWGHQVIRDNAIQNRD